ncbi:MAG: RsmB/NOP family class I SAM-dependent RNA methyltransferase [Defluviitaleaceae bacterium]|nr:RsmB/NOP family class I SAM-dependent RNA methyltransferase [Defluviitaleaceae bacterium]
MIQLPELFLTNMKELLGEEYEAFLGSYNDPTRRGLRFNLLKTSCATLVRCQGDSSDDTFRNLIPVPWCGEGYEYPGDMRPAKSILYNAGLFYIQEPSAMCPAAILRPEPGDRVLDLCAAPGGKSVQLAGYMQGRGVLVSNDASPSRAKALVKNLELAGVTNAIVLTEMPYRLADRFEGYFDCILVDAPCSGEGMFRRDPDAIKAYTANKPEACAQIQQDILHHASRMLKPGGRMVYSTCTFNTVENEGSINDFISSYEGYKLNLIKRIWPHKDPGEGHFIAHMTKAGKRDFSPDIPINKPPREFEAFCDEALESFPFTGGRFYLGDIAKSNSQRLFFLPQALELSGLRVARSGWLLGEISKGRFIPSQALAMGIIKTQARHAVDLSESDATRYLKGESLATEKDIPGKPWILICYQGHPLGWARLVQGRLKNHLPTGWVLA